MTNSTSALRRSWGVFCLGVGSGMLIWGRTVLQPHLEGSVFVLYWCAFAAFTSAAVGFGWAELLAERTRTRAEQAQLLTQALADLHEPDVPEELVEQGEAPASHAAAQDR